MSNKIRIQGSFKDTVVNISQGKTTRDQILPKLYGFSDRTNVESLSQDDNSIGRKEDIDKILDIFTRNKTFDRRVMITGIAGIGKTFLAKHCARRWVDDQQFNHAIFINMEKVESARKTFSELAKQIGKKNTSEIDCIREVYESFNKKRSLFILDNIDYEDYYLGDFLPADSRKNIFILGTSQLTEHQLFTCHSLQSLSENAGLELIIYRINNSKISFRINDTKPKLLKLIKLLGCHPLALQQAAAFIVNKTSFSKPKRSVLYHISEYIKKLEINLEKLKKETSGSDNYYRTPVYTALKMNIEKATSDNRAFKLLYCLAFLDIFKIRTNMFFDYNMDDASEGMQVLESYSIIEIDGDQIDAHRLTLNICREILPEKADSIIKEESIIKELLIILFNANKLNRLLFDKVNYEKLLNVYISAFQESQMQIRLIQRLEEIDFNITSTNNWSVFYYSIFARHKNLVDDILKRNAIDENEDNEAVWQLYHVCILSNYLEIIDFLKYKSDKLKPINDLPVFHFAAICGIDIKHFKLLLNIYDINMEDNNGNTALMCAAQYEHYDLALTLIKEKANTFVRNRSGQNITNLIRCTKYNKTGFQVVKLLIHLGTNISDFIRIENSILHLIAANGDDALFHHVYSQLSKSDETINTADNEGNTYLHLAAANNKFYMVKYLIDNGADVNRLNNYSENSLHLHYYHNKTKKRIRSPVVHLLIKNRTDVNTTNAKGVSCLYQIIRNGDSNAIELLLGTIAEKRDEIISLFETLNENNIICIAIRTGKYLCKNQNNTKYMIFKKVDVNLKLQRLPDARNSLIKRLIVCYARKEQLTVDDVINFLIYSPDNEDVSFVMNHVITGEEYKHFYKLIILIIHTIEHKYPEEFIVICRASFLDFYFMIEKPNGVDYILRNFEISEIFGGHLCVLGIVKSCILLHLELLNKYNELFFNLLDDLLYEKFYLSTVDNEKIIFSQIYDTNIGDWSYLLNSLKAKDFGEYYSRRKDVLRNTSVFVQAATDPRPGSWKMLLRLLKLNQDERTLPNGHILSTMPENHPSVLQAAITSPSKVDILIRNCFDLDGVDDKGKSALHKAAEMDKWNIINTLVNSGANINIQDINGNTPAHNAIQSNRLYSLKLLLDLGANKEIKNNSNQSIIAMLKGKNLTYINIKNTSSYQLRKNKTVEFEHFIVPILESVEEGVTILKHNQVLDENEDKINNLVSELCGIKDAVHMASRLLQEEKMSISDLLNYLIHSPDCEELSRFMDQCGTGKEFKAVYKLVFLVLKKLKQNYEKDFRLFCETCFCHSCALHYPDYLEHNFEAFDSYGFWLRHGRTAVFSSLPLLITPVWLFSENIAEEILSSEIVKCVIRIYLETSGDRQKILFSLLGKQLDLSIPLPVDEYLHSLCYMSADDIVNYYKERMELKAPYINYSPGTDEISDVNVLHCACAYSSQHSWQMVRRLIQLGEDVNKSVFGITPRYLANRTGRRLIIEELESVGAVEYS